MKILFEEELNYFIANQEELVNKYEGKILVIQGENILGVFDCNLDAYLAVKENNLLGKAMIQGCISGPDAYTTYTY